MRPFSYFFTPTLLIPILRPNYSWETPACNWHLGYVSQIVYDFRR